MKKRNRKRFALPIQNRVKRKRKRIVVHRSFRNKVNLRKVATNMSS